jgi:hypothetical protein
MSKLKQPKSDAERAVAPALQIVSLWGSTPETGNKSRTNWEQIGNKWRETPVKQGDQAVRKLLKSKDGLIDFSTHNPKVVSSNLTPATMGAYEANPLSALLLYSYELSRSKPLT